MGLFSGTYYTVWYGDSTLENELEYLEENENIDMDKVDTVTDWEAYLTAIGEEYASELEQYFGDDVTIGVAGVWSPKFYNYDTDHIILNLSSANLSENELETQAQNVLDKVNNNEYVDSLELYIYDKYGYELFMDNTTITTN